MNLIGKLQVIFDHAFTKEGNHITKAIILNKHGKFMAKGHSECTNPNCFSKDDGRKRALKAAFAKEKNLSKRQRASFWEAYRTEMTKEPRW